MLEVGCTTLDAGMFETDDLMKYEASLPDLPEEPEVVHYVDNEEMLAAYITYQAKRKNAIAEGMPEPPITRYLGECILKICHRTAYKYNFINYSFRDEMISDAIENCVRGFNSFDPAASKYIFSYYTTAAWNAFVRRIQREERQAAIKGRIISELDIDSIVTQEHDNGEYQAEFVEYMKHAVDFKEKHKKKEKPEDQVDEVDTEPEGALVFDDWKREMLLFDDEQPDEPEKKVLKAKHKTVKPINKPNNTNDPIGKMPDPSYLEITQHTLTHPAKSYAVSRAILQEQRYGRKPPEPHATWDEYWKTQ